MQLFLYFYMNFTFMKNNIIPQKYQSDRNWDTIELYLYCNRLRSINCNNAIYIRYLNFRLTGQIVPKADSEVELKPSDHWCSIENCSSKDNPIIV